MILSELEQALPAIPESAHSASTRFQHVSTLDVARVLYSKGWEARHVTGQNPRNVEERAFAKHLIRFSHTEGVGFSQTPGTALEVVLINAHNGTTAMRLACGFLRFVCMNGMIVGDKMGEVRLVHRGEIDTPEQLVTRALGAANRGIEDIKDLRSATPTWAARKQFAAEVAKNSWNDLVDVDLATVGLLTPRRADDLAGDAWTVLNTVQENVLKGGFMLEERVGKRNRMAQSIKGVSRNWDINRKVWEIAKETLV